MATDILTTCYKKGDDGLEHFLSLRIRHGSLTGYLRAPLERTELVEQGELTRQSSLAQRWIEKMSTSDFGAVNKVISGLSNFQKKFDALIEDVRSNYIQVQSADKPKGLFAPKFQKLVWDAYHIEWEAAETFDKYFDTIWDAFRLTLEAGLEDVRDLMSNDVFKKSEQLFLELRSFVDAAGASDADRATIVAAINRGATDFQEAIRTVTQWFKYKDDSADNAVISFEQLVELAKKVFSNARPALTIAITNHSELDPDVRLAGGAAPQLIDAFFIILDNVYKHSGLTESAAVDLWAEWQVANEGKGVLILEVENALADHIDKDYVKGEFKKKKAILSKGGDDKLLVSEGGSGLIKLSRIAKRNDAQMETPLDFFVTEAGNVRVIVRVAFSSQKATLFGE